MASTARTVGLLLALVFAAGSVESSHAQIFRDDFGVDGAPLANPHDFTDGQPFGIWNGGALNPTNGGDGISGIGEIRSDSTGNDAVARPGKLYMTDTATFVNTPGSGITGVGWEAINRMLPSCIEIFLEIPTSLQPQSLTGRRTVTGRLQPSLSATKALPLVT
jgi:hypothetical protein